MWDHSPVDDAPRLAATRRCGTRPGNREVDARESLVETGARDLTVGQADMIGDVTMGILKAQ